jgi:hypothetical protein
MKFLYFQLERSLTTRSCRKLTVSIEFAKTLVVGRKDGSCWNLARPGKFKPQACRYVTV